LSNTNKIPGKNKYDTVSEHIKKTKNKKIRQQKKTDERKNIMIYSG